MTVTNDDVAWCYRSILGREPDSPEIVQKHAGAAEDFRSLVLDFLRSREYREQRVEAPAAPINGPAMLVELRASPSELAQLTERVGRAWTHLGVSRPHHSVLSAQAYLPQNLNETSTDRFWDSGSHEVALIDAMLKRYGFDNLASKNCVEYGCGLGRVTLPLAKIFSTIDAYDISAPHLALAEQHAKEQGIGNIVFHHIGEEVATDELNECDFYYSRLVFQHNPPPLIRELIVQSLRSLRSGGIAMFQVPTYSLDYAFRLSEYLASDWRADMEMHFVPQSEVFSLVAEAHCRMLEVQVDNSIGMLGRWISNLFIVQRPV